MVFRIMVKSVVESSELCLYNLKYTFLMRFFDVADHVLKMA